MNSDQLMCWIHGWEVMGTFRRFDNDWVLRIKDPEGNRTCEIFETHREVTDAFRAVFKKVSEQGE